MSADLFAEFSTNSSKDETRQPSLSTRPASTFSFFDDLNSQAPGPVSLQPATSAYSFGHTGNLPAQPATEDDADDWGDFEGGSNHTNVTPSVQHDPFAFVSSQQPQPPQQALAGQPSIHDPFSFQPTSLSPPSQESWTKAPIVRAKKPLDSNVLFDAEDDLDDDDFGDFEDSQPRSIAQVGLAPSAPVPSTGASSALVDLLGGLDLSQSAAKPRPAARENSTIGFRTSPKTKQAQPKAKAEPVPAAKAHIAVDDWDTFDDWEASIPTSAPSKPQATVDTSTSENSTLAPILSAAIDDVPSGELPPTNIPPPGVLLSLFPSFFADAQEQLFKPMAAQTLPMRNKLLAEPGTIAYLRGYLMLASVAAHIIAGRKLRWKRDQLLSQGMRIGPASSRATSGMKLTGIDRGENLKEEREASDVARAWKDQIGRLRHVISGVNQIQAGTLSPAPDLQETMPVRTLKQAEGGVPARQPCMLCGLKRDERVTVADMAVEDSFGEWWIEQVNMHRGCRNFWNEHKDRLKQR
ncbi:hypothetical protein SVAN01_00896 [Stagonosporopsis vannaccii]|nr:hypothetical protein SVAN01_00896 [Stagonosporopsis vannaccii]